jgi:L-fuculose-phosphate aldolase
MPARPTALLADLALASRELAREGHEDLTLGHLAARDPGGRGLWIKRSGIGLSEVHDADDFILLDFTGRRLAGSGGRHIEWPIHAAIMLIRPDVQVTAHTHPAACRLLAATDEPLRQVCNEAVLFVDGLPRFTETCDLIRTRELGAALASCLRQARAVLLANHGAAFCAATVPELLFTGLFLERAAAAQLALAATGWLVREADPADAAAKRGRTCSPRAVAAAWAYHVRQDGRLSAHDPAEPLLVHERSATCA